MVGHGVKRLLGPLVCCAALWGCGEQEVILPGERLDVRGNEISTETVNRSLAISLAAPLVNRDWSHSGGNTRHQISHPALDRDLQLAWSVDIGEGNGRKHRITADPVVFNGTIFAMDSRARVSAVSSAGGLVWSTDLTPASDASDDASGGGLAVGGGTLFVSSGFGRLVAMNAANGEVLWTQDLDAAATGAPIISDGTVYVVTRNATGWAVDAKNGRVLWQVFGTESPSGLAGGAAPSIAGPLVVFPFSSGQMVSAIANTGAQAWSASVAGQRLGRGFSRVSDLSSGPVVVNNTVYAGSHAGRAAAFDITSGASVWRANEGAIGPLWVTGGSVFMVSDENRLLRLDASSGEVIWARDLPFFENDRIRRRKATFGHFGPVLAGGRLIVASDDGVLRQIDPVDGSILGTITLTDGAARNPVVAGNTLYLVTDNGALAAFR